MNEYPTLKLAVKILRFIGWLMIIAAIAVGVVTIFSSGGLPGFFSNIVVTLTGVLQGILLIAAGELIQLLFVLDSRTSSLARNVERIQQKLPEQSV